MKFILESTKPYYLIEIVRVDNNRLLNKWKFDDADDAWDHFNSNFGYAQEEANALETLLEMSLTLMGPNEEELAVEYFDYE